MVTLAQKRAEKLLQAGLQFVAQGELHLARDKFRDSAEQFPTADALTYWGWMEHNLGDTDAAIELCKQAVDTDPDFGNPYNDIGSYLIAKGEMDDAIPWLEKAIQAKRYEPRHYPHINLGKIFLAKEMPLRALREFQLALIFCPEDTELMGAIERIKQTIN